MVNDDEVTVQSFVDAIPAKERQSLEWELRSFVVRHSSHHRPIALVSSGGTAADLEVHSVRCLDNFSTGLRGAISVEEFLKRGYAVIHLWRTGSASPYGRLLSQALGIPAPNQGITMASLGKLFATGDLEDDQEDQLVQSVLDDAHKNDPWLSDPNHVGGAAGTTGSGTTPKRSNNGNNGKRALEAGNIHLHRRIVNSSTIRTALIERQAALEDGRILTLPFRSVEDYLARLQLAAISLRDSQALAIFFLAAAVSDFYVPLSERSTHKIQSRDMRDGMTLKLRPVPKVMGLLRTRWAPDAFICSFKLETDYLILRRKAEGAVEKYGCHMVIGNLLETRHSRVWILAPSNMQAFMDEQMSSTESSGGDGDFLNSNQSWNVQEWPMREVSRPQSSSVDTLEAMIMENVIQTHFEYISVSSSGSFDKSGTAAVLRAHQELDRKRRLVETEAFWNRVQSVALEWAGVAIGAALSYIVSTALRRRMNP
jgi:phosphopantothenate-cysteine ligase